MKETYRKQSAGSSQKAAGRHAGGGGCRGEQSTMFSVVVVDWSFFGAHNFNSLGENQKIVLKNCNKLVITAKSRRQHAGRPQ